MKKLALYSLMALLVGCSSAKPPTPLPVESPKPSVREPKASIKERYIAANHCTVEGRRDGHKILRADGSIGEPNGWTVYKCPNGVFVVLDDDEVTK